MERKKKRRRKDEKTLESHLDLLGVSLRSYRSLT